VSDEIVIDLSNRRTLVESLNNAKFTRGVEVGVRLGWYSKYILENTQMTLDCIDPWEKNKELIAYWNEAYDFCSMLLDPYIKSDRCRLIRALSPKASEAYEDDSIDFVYIDALHDYESVKADLEAWYPKVGMGKLLCGHDYSETDWPGLVRAVDEFCEDRNLKAHLTGVVGNAEESETGNADEYDGDQCSYVIVKA
jgi:hypothetical protein